MVKYLIVGVDPGTTTGVAALDLYGRVVDVRSSRDMGASNVVEYIMSLGLPSLIACDVNPAPLFAAKIASKFGVILYVPDETMQVAQKLELTRGFKTSDAHQRDALAAALNAFTHYRKKLGKIDSLGLGPKVKHFVLQGNSISRAREEVKPVKAVVHAKAKPKSKPKSLSAGEKRIRSLEKRVKALSEELSERDERIMGLEWELAQLKTRNHIKTESRPTADKRIKSLKSRVRELEETENLLVAAASGDMQLVGVYPTVLNGLTLVDKRPDTTEGIGVAFTSKRKVREILLERGVEVHDASLVQSHVGVHYIKAEKMNEIKEETPDIEKIITEYRKKRG
jgi:predicted RNase H-like nuclease (RuvC/YqgF family)